jgi:hypothetical protein
MNEFRILREWLSQQSLTPIAKVTGINRRTLQRIVTEDDYLVKVDKYLVLKAAMDGSNKKHTKKAAA